MRAAVLILLASAPAAAEPAPEHIELVYAAPSGCPDADAFFAGVHARTNVVRAEHGDRRFRVTIEAGETVTGRLVVESTDGGEAPTTREVSGATCAETALALALVAALAIEEKRVAPPPPPPPSRIVPTGDEWHIAVGAGVARTSGVAPSAAYGLPVFASARYGHLRLRLGVATTERVDAVMTDFRWTIGRVEACPYAVTIDRFEAAPCVGFEAGILDGRGTAVAMPTSDTRPWLAPDGVLRLSARLGPAVIALEGQLAAPLVRDRFFIAPSTTVHQVPAVTTGASASLAFELW